MRVARFALRWGLRCAVLLVVLVCLGVAFVPNPVRMLAPTLFGMKEIAPQVFVPQATKASLTGLLVEIDRAYAKVEAFYGRPLPRTPIILCPDDHCDRVFGKQAFAGYAFGTFVVRVNARGMNGPLITHELAHVAFAHQLGNLRLILGTTPHWFNEGMSVVVAQDLDDRIFVEPRIKEALGTKPHWTGWSGQVRDFGWRKAYAGAAQKVRALDRALGGGQLVALVALLEQGHGFEQSIAMIKERVSKL